MNSTDYLDQSSRTVANEWEDQNARLATKEGMDLLHAGIGMCTESGEFIDALKKSIFYGKPLDTINLKEELGDLLWYIALAMRTLDTDFDIEMQKNIDKLFARYPSKFTEKDALHRNLLAEAAILER